MTSTNVSNGWRWIGLIVLLLILLILWLMGFGPSFSGSTPGCCGIPMASPEATAIPEIKPKSAVKLSLQTTAGKIMLGGEVPTEAEKLKLAQAATELFGAGNIVDRLTVADNASLPEWWPRLNSMLSWLKKGIDLGFDQNGATLTLTGKVDSDAAKQSEEDEIGALVGPNIAIDNQIALIAKAVEATSQILPCSNKMSVTILFANNSAALTDEGKKRLDQLTPCLTGPTEVAGHTDSVGSDTFNKGLSRARANSVIDYISSIDHDKKAWLTPTGYGEIKPVASNATEEGRAKNRRIEFTTK